MFTQFGTSPLAMNDFTMRTVSDAIASSNEASHEAAFDGIYPRFDQQVELIDTDTLLKAWTP